MTDYPSALVTIDHIEPVPRRIRATLGGVTVVDTTSALYVWEWPYFPQLYIPVADVDSDALVDEDHAQHLHRGTAGRHGLRVGDIERPGCALVFGDDALEGLAGTVRLEWAALDAWYEEDEQVFVHPRSPYARVDALRSTRTVRVELEGVVLAESSSPVLVFETGLPPATTSTAPRWTSPIWSPATPSAPVPTRGGLPATGPWMSVAPCIPIWPGPTTPPPWP